MKMCACMVMLLAFAACSSPTKTVLVVEEWGPAEDELKTVEHFRIDPFLLPDSVDGDLSSEESDWARQWPVEGAEHFAAGAAGKSADLFTASTSGDNQVSVEVVVEYLDLGDGAKRYWGAKPGRGASRIEGVVVVRDKDGRLVVRLRLLHETYKGNVGLAYHDDCLVSGEEFGRWVAAQKRGNR